MDETSGPVTVRQSVSGFVASTPRVGVTEAGKTRMYVRVGQEHWTRNQDGTFTQNEPSFHDLVMFGRAGERAAQAFRKGDRFIAEGAPRQYAHQNPDGTAVLR